MKYFVVFQGKTFKQEHKEGILWAPSTAKNGEKPSFHWENMTKCNPGDVIFSVVKNRIVARGIVSFKAISKENPFDNDLWTRDGWLVKLDYSFIDNPIKISDRIKEIRPLLQEKYAPFIKKTGFGNVGYLFDCTDELGRYFDNLISDIYLGEDLEKVFVITPDEALIIENILSESGKQNADFVIIENSIPVGSNRPKSKKKKINYKKTDFMKKAEKDIAKGMLAEKLVEAYEKNELMRNGRSDLADKVKWVAAEADGFGYDILSYYKDGREKFIEVKGTSLGERHPFDISINEVFTSQEKGEDYWIYRVYHLDSNSPEFYKVQGPVDKFFDLSATSFKAFFKNQE